MTDQGVAATNANLATDASSIANGNSSSDISNNFASTANAADYSLSGIDQSYATGSVAASNGTEDGLPYYRTVVGYTFANGSSIYTSGPGTPTAVPYTPVTDPPLPALPPPPPETPPTGDGGGGEGGGEGGGKGDPTQKQNPDPLVLSLDGRGINLTSAAQSGVSFDYTGGGTKTPTGWIGADTGLLVRDTNGNGVIDNGSELVGDAPAAGFAALAALDSNGDGVINAADTAYASLKVWVDANGDGLSEPGELYTLGQLGISSINVAATSMLESVGGNLVTAAGSLTFSNGTTGAIDDVTFGSTVTSGATRNGQSAASLAFLARVLQGLPVETKGEADAVASAMAQNIATMTQWDNATVADQGINKGSFTSYGNSQPAALSDAAVNIVTSYGQLIYLSPAGPVRQGEAALQQALTAVQSAATAVDAASQSETRSDLDTATANIEDAGYGTTDDYTANEAGAATETAWQQAVTAILTAEGSLANANADIQAAQSGVNQIILPNNVGQTYASAGDAKQALDLINEQTAAANTVALGDAALNMLVGTIAQAWTETGPALTPDGSTTLLATTTAYNELGTGGLDLMLQNSSGQVGVWELDAATDTITGTGFGNVTNLSNSAVALGAANAGAPFLVLGTGDQLTATGDTIELSPAEASIMVTGAGNEISAAGSGAILSVNGGGNTINSGVNDQLLINGTGGSFDTIDATGDAFGGTTLGGQATGILLGSNVQANVYGNGNGIWAASSGISLGVYGGGNTITGSAGDLIVIGSTGGVFDTINANAVQNGGTTANGQTTGILFSGTAQASVDGSNNTITMNAGGTVDLNGNGDVVQVGAGATATITVNGTGDRLVTSAATANQLTLTQSGSDLIIGIAGTTTADTVKNWFVSPASQFAEIDAADGSSVVLNGGTMLGSGHNLLGLGGHDMLWRTGSGQGVVWETSTSGQLLADVPLTYNGSPVTLNTGATVIAAGRNFLGQGGEDLLVTNGTGNTSIWEVGAAGAITGNVPLNINGSTVSLSGLAVVGGGSDFLHEGGNDLIVTTAAGNAYLWEINTAGAITGFVALTSNGAPVTFNGVSIIGEGTDFLHEGGTDLIVSNGIGNATLWEISPTGAITGNIALTFNGAPVSFSGITFLGQGSDFLHEGGNDLFVSNAAGNVSIWEVNTSGAIVGNVALTSNGNSVSFGGVTFVGQGTDFLHEGGEDLVVLNALGDATIWEVNTAGAITGNVAITSNGSPVSFSDVTFVGEGTDFLHEGGNDFFVLNAFGDASIWEVNASGTLTGNVAVTSNGAPVSFNGVSIVGQGTNFLHKGGTDLIVLNAIGNAAVWEINTAGAIIGNVALTSNGSPVSFSGVSFVGQGSDFLRVSDVSFVGQGSDFLRQGGNDMIVLNGFGNASIWEVNTAGAITGNVALTFNGAAVSFNGVSFVGQGTDFLGEGGYDLIVLNAVGNATIWEVNTAGTTTGSVALTSGGNPVSFNGVSFVGQGDDILGQGGNDLIVLNGVGNATIWEINTAGGIIGDVALTAGGNPVSFAGVSLLGQGTDLLGEGGNDLIVLNAVGDAAIWEINTAGAIIGNVAVTSGGNPIAFSSISLIGQGTNFLGKGGSDLILLNGLGNAAIWEVNTAGAIIGNVAITVNGGSVSFAGVSFVGQANDLLGKGGSGLIVLNALGNAVVWEINTAGAIIGNVAISSSGNPITFAAGTTVIGSGQNLLGDGGNDLLTRTGAGQLMLWELNGSGQVLASQIEAHPGELDLSPAINDTNVWIDRVNSAGAVSATGNNLRIDVLGTNESMTIDGWFSSGGPQTTISAIGLPGSSLIANTQISSLVQAMATFEAGYSSSHGGAIFDPTVPANAAITNSTLLTAVNQAWHH